MSGEKVEVGFADHLNNPLLFAPEHFPSKIGGHPAWLNPANIPNVPICQSCEEPLIFFAQIYAGLDRPSNGFHRMIFIFLCRKSSCYTDNQQPVCVLRSQLPADNPYYGLQPVPEGDADTNEIGVNKSFARTHNGYVNLCRVCGCKAPLKCSKCNSVFYCGRSHQKHDWSDHKIHCESLIGSQPLKPSYLTKSSLLFKEIDVIIERETEKENIKMDPEKLEEIKNATESLEMSAAEAESLSKEYGTDKDPTFTKFKDRISRDPSQILRYSRHDTPLWPAPTSQCSSTPPCTSCGAARSFEVQFLPTLLYVLGLGAVKDDMDWASVAVYTCSGDCEVEGYVEEFGWVQCYPDK